MASAAEVTCQALCLTPLSSAVLHIVATMKNTLLILWILQELADSIQVKNSIDYTMSLTSQI